VQFGEGEVVLASRFALELLGDSRRKLLLMMMGLPASGKTTLSRLLEKLGARRINRDAIRKELYGDEAAFGDWRQVDNEYYRQLREALVAGGPVISDNVNITRQHRAGTIAAARTLGYMDITIVYFDVALDVCLQRNQARSRQVSEDLIRSMHADLKKYGLPRASEGNLVVVQNGRDQEHYRITKVRSASPDHRARR
jgi:predicted kinase